MLPKRKKKVVNQGNWLMTYSDLMTLLLAFFVLLFSMSSIEDQKYQIMINSLQNALIGGNGETIFENPSGNDDVLITDQGEISDLVDQMEVLEELESEEEVLEAIGAGTEQLQGIVQTYLKGQGLDSEISVEIIDEGILLDIKETVLFDLGKSEIKPQSLSTLDKLGDLFNKFDNEIRVIGHTDNLPINTAKYPSNWELAAQRSCAVVRYYLNTDSTPQRYSCLSYGESRPIDTNDTEEGRAKNRRVNFLIEATPQEIEQLTKSLFQNED
ncbi:MAG: flagellar motor protein MotB [Turicibacter sp.]